MTQFFLYWNVGSNWGGGLPGIVSHYDRNFWKIFHIRNFKNSLIEWFFCHFIHNCAILCDKIFNLNKNREFLLKHGNFSKFLAPAALKMCHFSHFSIFKHFHIFCLFGTEKCGLSVPNSSRFVGHPHQFDPWLISMRK